MKLKHAILEQLGREKLKKICGDIEVGEVDLRSVETMRAKLSRAHRATPAVLFEHLNEAEVKAVAEAVGVDSHGRRGAIIERLLDGSDAGNEEPEELTLTAGAPAAMNIRERSGATGRRKRSGPVTNETEQYRHAEQAAWRAVTNDGRVGEWRYLICFFGSSGKRVGHFGA